MDTFVQIHDFSNKSAEKLENTFYLEDLTRLLAQTATLLDSNDNYLFGEEYYIDSHSEEINCGFHKFVECFKKSFYDGSCEKINIIRGRAGIGKSLFFEKGIKQLIKHGNCSDSYLKINIDFKSFDNDKDINYYVKHIYRKIRENAIDCIRLFDNNCYDLFNDEEKKFGTKDKTPFYFLFPLKFLCEKIYNKYKYPCVITLDNIDLTSVTTQEHIFKAIVEVFDKFNEFMKDKRSFNCYRVYFVMRPETELRYEEVNVGEVINFPLPNILKLSFALIKKVILETAIKFDSNSELLCNVTCRDVTLDIESERTFTTFTDVANYFVEILNLYLIRVWNDKSNICERLGTCEEFHCNIVNYNIRTFLRFLSDTISNGGFKPFTKDFNLKPNQQHYNTFDYIEMIIKGRWQVHPGNAHIYGEGSNKAPIVFNVFDTSLYNGGKKVKAQHFMLYIRILQFFLLCTTEQRVKFKQIKQSLAPFFKNKFIKNATKKLIHIHFLYSYEIGDNIVATIKDWKDVPLNNNTELKLSPVGKFYLENFICEFEYLYQMSLSSLVSEEYYNDLKLCWKIEKEKTVLYFLKSMFNIIKFNISEYNVENGLESFKNLFYYIDDERGSRPFRRMLDRFISIMEIKVKSANKYESNNTEKLNRILEEVIELKNDVNNYFKTMLG